MQRSQFNFYPLTHFSLIPFLKNNGTKALIIVCFSVLKKPRIAISILDFLSPLKQTIIRSFLVSLVFINGITRVFDECFEIVVSK